MEDEVKVEQEKYPTNDNNKFGSHPIKKPPVVKKESKSKTAGKTTGSNIPKSAKMEVESQSEDV